MRYKPIDEDRYPVQLWDGDMFYWRFWCRPEFIVYEKYKNNIRLGYLILPTEKEVFNFNQLENYVQTIKPGGEIMCVRE